MDSDNRDVVILGSFGIDSIKTPFGKVEEQFGGSAPYAALAASFFSNVGVIGIKGEDISEEKLDFMLKRGISLEGLQSKGKTLRWEAEYSYDMNEAKTLSVQVNSLNDFLPIVPDNFKKTKSLFVGNFDPEKQLAVIDKIKADFVLIDTIGFWIETKKEKLIEAIKKSDALILNEWEARELFGTSNLVKAGKSALDLGLKVVIIKKGEHGALLFTENEIFNCPGYPLENVVDPTGCGDSFGGAFIGYYTKSGDIRKAMVYASVVASFNAESFGIERMKNLSIKEIEERYMEMVKLREF